MATSSNRRTLITIRRRTSSAVDAVGQGVDTWTDVCTVFAQVQPLRGRELIAAAQEAAFADHRVTLQYRADILATDRVMVGTQELQIVGEPINVDMRGRDLELMCTSGRKGGL